MTKLLKDNKEERKEQVEKKGYITPSVKKFPPIKLSTGYTYYYYYYAS